MSERIDDADADARAREAALDTQRSFLVQAPAGSGKTELLIQRFLALLARVERPERIVAMTFTRKAAGEMRERILAALRAAADETELAPDASSHERRTRALAKAAIEQDRRCAWQLLAHPARLRVVTIDALAAEIARQAPLATRLGAAPRTEEHAGPLHARAVYAAIAGSAADDPAWRRLLDHLDNDVQHAIDLVAGMLAARGEWLLELPPEGGAGVREALERTITLEVEGELATIGKAFPPGCAPRLADMARYAAGNLAQEPAKTDLARRFGTLADAGGLPTTNAASLDHWHTLATWLLLADGSAFRAAVDTRGGIPAAGSGAGAKRRAERKADMDALLADLRGTPGLAEALRAASLLPSPRYSDEGWRIVEALFEILRRCAAQLQLVFRDERTVDFTQTALAALVALGNGEAPTDLLLKLDLSIEHLLVDEFQDTSFAQVELLHRLTAGWVPGDGRTLFAVGDPMQSIYGFRGAEVRLFVDAQDKGHVAGNAVVPLVLSRNFRSQATLVDWVNDVFAHVLGAINDPWRGAVAFAPATPVQEALPGDAVTLDALADAGLEADAVVARVRTELAESGDNVAILVRARSHLAAILPALRDAGIGYAAVELESLAERQGILDLLSLTHALAQPADRLAWLALLRAPWCGLALPDLLAVVAAADAQAGGSIAAVLDPDHWPRGLSPEGSVRFERLSRIFVPALAATGRASLAARVRGAWLALRGPATLDEAIDLDAAERFFALLAEHESAATVVDWQAFVDALAELKAAPAALDDARVQVMTLHKAKGLQFGTVILPGLAARTNRNNAPLLRWRRRPDGLLVAPMKPRGGESDPVYRYLGNLRAEEEDAELRRLLYVGATRARRRLHLLAVLDIDAKEGAPATWKAPRRRTALACMPDGLRAALPPPDSSSSSAAPGGAPTLLLQRLPAAWTPPAGPVEVPLHAEPPARDRSLPFDWARETARHVGTVAHRLLAQVGAEGVDAWSAARLVAERGRIRAELEREGVDPVEMDEALAQVEAAIARTLADARGRWLFDPGHADARSEWALAGVDGDAVVHVVLDRSFVAEGTRWIADFKTGAHEGADLDAFLDREVDRYRDQLERYARLVKALDARPIRLALYHPLHGGWREWAHDG